MPFSENVKLLVKRRSHFRCCLCHGIGVEVHHIISQEENGRDTEDNAAPLCPSCHETYGANPQKKKFIREARDFWYELCENQFAKDSESLKRIEEMIKGVASKTDIHDFVEGLQTTQKTIQGALTSLIEREHTVVRIDELRQKILQTEHELSARKESVEQFANQLATVSFVGEIAEGMLFKSSDRLTSEAAKAYGEICQILSELGHLKENVFLESMGNVQRGAPPPSDPHERLSYYSALLLKSAIQFDVISTMAAAFVPLLLEEYSKSPSRPGREVLESLFLRMNADKFLVELAKRGRGSSEVTSTKS